MTPEIRQIDSLPEYVRQAIAESRGRIMCPTCDGGRSREESLSIRAVDDDGVLVKLSCWRATCNWWCYVGLDGTEFKPTKLSVGQPYRGVLHAIDSLNLAPRLMVEYGLKSAVYKAHGWAVSHHGELVMPIRDPYGRERGHVTRTFTKPKRCFTYKTTAQPWLDWWLPEDKDSAVIVEDCLSACRLAGLGYTAVALLGTNMNLAQATEIAETAGSRPTHLALDRDAFEKAQKMRRRFAHVLGIDSVVCLSEDVKDMDTADIKELFGG